MLSSFQQVTKWIVWASLLHLTCTKGQVKCMNRVLGQLKVLGEAAAKQAKVRKGLVAILAVFFVLQIYFVRELLAAELLFGLLFALVLVMAGIFYVLGTLGERALDVGEAGARVIAHSTRARLWPGRRDRPESQRATCIRSPRANSIKFAASQAACRRRPF